MSARPLVALVEPALPAAIFARLARAVAALGEEGLAQTWQTTFWFPRGARPACVVEEALLALDFTPPRGSTGIEWWLSRMRTSRVPIDFHRDHDIVLAERGGPVRHPQVSSVLFLNRCVGGRLVVTRERPNPNNPALAPTRHAFDLVTPQPNRLAFFEGRLTHGVLDAKNQIPGGRLPRQSGLRLAVAINFWKKQPLGARPFAEVGIYPRLAKRRPGAV